MWVYTIDKKDTSLSDRINLTVYGHNGASKDIKLRSNLASNNYDRYKLDIVDIGTPFKLRICLNGKSISASWHVDRV